MAVNESIWRRRAELEEALLDLGQLLESYKDVLGTANAADTPAWLWCVEGRATSVQEAFERLCAELPSEAGDRGGYAPSAQSAVHLASQRSDVRAPAGGSAGAGR